jgi:hypothetical protein
MIAVSGVTAITPNPGRSFLGWLASMLGTNKVNYQSQLSLWLSLPRNRKLIWGIVQRDFQIGQFAFYLNIYGVHRKRGALELIHFRGALEIHSKMRW